MNKRPIDPLSEDFMKAFGATSKKLNDSQKHIVESTRLKPSTITTSAGTNVYRQAHAAPKAILEQISAEKTKRKEAEIASTKANQAKIRNEELEIVAEDKASIKAHIAKLQKMYADAEKKNKAKGETFSSVEMSQIRQAIEAYTKQLKEDVLDEGKVKEIQKRAEAMAAFPRPYVAPSKSKALDKADKEGNKAAEYNKRLKKEEVEVVEEDASNVNKLKAAVEKDQAELRKLDPKKDKTMFNHLVNKIAENKKAIAFYMKEEVEELDEGYKVGDMVNATNPNATPRYKIVGKTDTHYELERHDQGKRTGETLKLPKSRIARVNKQAWDIAKNDPEKMEKRKTANMKEEVITETVMKLDKVNHVHAGTAEEKAFARDYVKGHKGDYAEGGPTKEHEKHANDFHSKYTHKQIKSGFAGSGTAHYTHKSTGKTFEVRRTPNGKTFYGTDHHIAHID